MQASNEYVPDLLKFVKISVNTDLSNNLYLTSTFNPQCNALPDLTIYRPGTNTVVKEIKVNSLNTYNRAIFNIKFDSSGNYFDLHMNGLQPERYYNIIIKSTVSGSTIVHEDNNYFKVVR